MEGANRMSSKFQWNCCVARLLYSTFFLLLFCVSLNFHFAYIDSHPKHPKPQKNLTIKSTFLPNPQKQKLPTLRLLTPPMETPDPPNDTPWGLKTGGFDTPWHPTTNQFPTSPNGFLRRPGLMCKLFKVSNSEFRSEGRKWHAKCRRRLGTNRGYTTPPPQTPKATENTKK